DGSPWSALRPPLHYRLLFSVSLHLVKGMLSINLACRKTCYPSISFSGPQPTRSAAGGETSATNPCRERVQSCRKACPPRDARRDTQPWTSLSLLFVGGNFFSVGRCLCWASTLASVMR